MARAPDNSTATWVHLYSQVHALLVKACWPCLLLTSQHREAKEPQLESLAFSLACGLLQGFLQKQVRALTLEKKQGVFFYFNPSLSVLTLNLGALSPNALLKSDSNASKPPFPGVKLLNLERT